VASILFSDLFSCCRNLDDAVPPIGAYYMGGISNGRRLGMRDFKCTAWGVREWNGLTDFSYRFFAGKSIREWRWLRGSRGQIYRGRNRRIRRNRRILTFEMSICQSCYGISPFPVSYYRHLRELHFYVFILLFSGTRNTRIYSILPLITWTSGNYLFGVSLRLTGSFPRPQIAAKLEFPARSRYCTFRMIYAVFLT